MYTITEDRGLEVQELTGAQASLPRLVELACEGLVPMFDPQQQLFCYRLKKTDSGLVQEGISRRYTMMCLMGLRRLEEGGAALPIAIAPVLEGLLGDTSWVDNIGDLGVLLWTCAVVAPERLNGLGEKLDVAHAFSRYRHTQHWRTMELAWFLTGLCHWGLARPEKLAELKDLAFQTVAILRKNQGEHGYFGHLARTGSIAGMLRGRIGSFADQVYPIYAMTRFWQAFGEQTAREAALHCARAICQAQGPLGQWWWHYDAVNGRVVNGYPVFSVHQHGMAPMTLLALGEATQCDFTPWIYRGLRWINSHNELDFEMEDASARLIWRCVFSSSFQFKRKINALFKLRNHDGEQEPAKNLKVRFECRPYELGWLLYAFAARPVPRLCRLTESGTAAMNSNR
jgi:hypothetical protein